MKVRSALTPVLCVAACTGLLAQASKGVESFDAAWTIVRDSHFDPGLNGVDWAAVRDELRPRAQSASTDGELRAVIRDMLGRLGQSHFALIPSSADTPRGSLDLAGDPGFEVRPVGSDVLVTWVDPQGASGAAGIQAGWKLTSIDSRAVSDLLAALPEGLSPRLHHVEAWRILESRLRGPRGSRLQAAFEDGEGRPVTLGIERRPERGQPATIGNLPTMSVRVETQSRRTPAGRQVGVVGFNVWMPIVDAEFQRAIDSFRSSHGIVIDLRGNPGGLAAMLMGISGHFLSDRTPLGVMRTRDNELRFAANPRLVNAAGERVQPFSGPVAILVDGLTGSASECFAGGMQSLGRARVFGQTTMGQALPALFDKLPNGDVLIHAYGDFVTANGIRLEGRGVIPDEAVPVRREDLLAGRDAPLLAALAWIDGASGRSDTGVPKD